MDDWISVKDRLPEFGETVLCRREDGLEFVDANFWLGHKGIDFWKPLKGGIIDYGWTGEKGERGVAVHQLKILPQYFQAVWSGIKTFELRKDDRDYQVGDILALREWDGEKYTGSAIRVKVTYILQNAEKYGLKDGYVIMGIRHLEPGDMREEN